MPNFGEDPIVPTFGSVTANGEGGSNEKGAWCYSQTIRLGVGFSQGDLQAACEHMWRFSANVIKTNYSFRPGLRCYETGCPIVETFTISNESFQYRNRVGEPYNDYDVANNNVDWTTLLCEKTIQDDPSPTFSPGPLPFGQKNEWDFQYRADVTIEGCSEQHPRSPFNRRVFSPNPVNPKNGKLGPWKVDTDCTPRSGGDKRRMGELQGFIDCFCNLKTKLQFNDIDRDQFDACFAEIIANYVKKMRLGDDVGTAGYDPKDPDTWNELNPAYILPPECPPCSK